jgi:ketosteroid isomerase-like protein
MTDIETNKDIAREYFERFSRGDIAGALDLVDDDVRWWLAGKPDRLPVAGWHTKATFARLIGRTLEGVRDGVALTVTSAIGEGDRVALEVVSHAELLDGRAYDNEFHILMELSDGKIRYVREYHDTQHVHEVWLRDRPPRGATA